MIAAATPTHQFTPQYETVFLYFDIKLYIVYHKLPFLSTGFREDLSQINTIAAGIIHKLNDPF